MTWEETCLMDERTEFIVAWKRGLLPMTALCEAHGNSRKTGYKWRDRYLAFGWDGLVDLSRARHELGHTMGAENAAAVIALRQKHPLLGPRKLKQVLERDCPDFAWPAASTIGDLLRREGLSEARADAGAGLCPSPNRPPRRDFRTICGASTSRDGSARGTDSVAIP